LTVSRCHVPTDFRGKKLDEYLSVAEEEVRSFQVSLEEQSKRQTVILTVVLIVARAFVPVKAGEPQ
jgi:hypothetical protein